MKLPTLTVWVVFGMLSAGFAHADSPQAKANTDLPSGFEKGHREKHCINTDWRFHLGDADAQFYTALLEDSDWEVVSVPHTLKLTSLALDGCEDDKFQKTFHRTVGWYRKTLAVTGDPTKKVFLEFEGAHQVTDLWVNGKHVGQHRVSGYTPFHFDISNYVQRGQENQITLRVDNRVYTDVPPDPGPFDYIKFSGLYRDVYLVQTDPVHVTFNWEALDAGVTITTPIVDPVNKNAVIDFKTVIRNEQAEEQNVTVQTRLIDHSGLVVLKLETTQPIPPGEDKAFRQIGAIEDDLKLWSCDDPYLYRANTLVLVDGAPVDMQENRVGVRKFELDPERGFLLNQEPIKLIGFNRHQHYGYIGDALPDSLHYKDVLQLKQMGLNTLRTAHYPQDNALIDACDELGILVYEEAPTWISISQDPAWYENYERATRAMIRNHRNHPSIVIWGAGINHRGYVPQGVLACKQEDPTRLTASQSSRWTGWQNSGLTEIFANMMYGDGIWDRSEPLLAMEGWYGPEAVAPYKRDPKMTGMISWTAHAYYTFHIFHKMTKRDRTRLGIMSVFRRPKRGAQWYPSEFLEEPIVHIQEPWKEGIEELTVYSNAEEVELLLNGEPYLRQAPSADAKYEGLDHPPFHFTIDRFEPGELTARGWTGGEVVASTTVRTPGRPQRVELLLDTADRSFHADGADILVGHATIVDQEGTLCEDAEIDVHFSVEGPASIVGDGAGIEANPFETIGGVAPLLLRAGKTPGEVVIKAAAPGLEPGLFRVTSTAKNNDQVAANAGPIYDFQKVRVDLGAEDQLVQFGWTPWNGADNEPSQLQLPTFAGATATLQTATDEGVLRWLGEMNVIGKYGFVYGEGVLAMDQEGLLLEFSGLPKGRYRLSTWHHAPRSNTNSMDPNRERLKKETIHTLPYAKTLQIEVSDAAQKTRGTTPVTAGKEMQFEPIAIANTTFLSDGERPVQIRFRDSAGAKGIWLNGFELSQWHADLPAN